MLALVIVLSGCLSGNTADADESEPTVINNYYNQTTNELPVFHIAGVGYDENYLEQRSTYNSTTGTEETRMYYKIFQFWFSVSDIDGNITAVGLDFDLDHSIDHAFSSSESWTNFSYHESPGIAFANGSMANYGNGEWAEYEQYCFATFNLIAIDDDSGVTLVPYTLPMNSYQTPDTCEDDYTGWEDN